MCWICKHFSYDKTLYLQSLFKYPLTIPACGRKVLLQLRSLQLSQRWNIFAWWLENSCSFCFSFCFLPLLLPDRSEEEWIPNGTVIKYKTMKNYLDLFPPTPISPRALVENKVNAANDILGSTFWSILKNRWLNKRSALPCSYFFFLWVV